MMGIQTAPAQLFYDICLDDHNPDDHQLRRIDKFLDLAKVRTELKPFYSTIGRPSIDPELMMRMLIVGYCMEIRFERRLCEAFHLNLAYRYFCRLRLNGNAGSFHVLPQSCGICSRRSWSGACRKAWSVAKGLLWTQASSR
jgi:transposase